MNGLRKRIASIAALSLIAGATLPANALGPVARTAVPQSVARAQVAGVPRSIVPSRDFGRRQPSALVTASVMLRYNREAELDALVNAQSNPRSPLYHHFLTSDQFNNYFAPTPQQQAFVVAKLQAAGLRVTQTFPNRTIIDVRGTSGSAERFFGTEIHSILQGQYGARFANVKPATVPASIAPFVRYVSLSNLIIARTRPLAKPHYQAPTSVHASIAGPSWKIPPPARFIVPGDDWDNISPDVTNVVKDSSFESGEFGHGWSRCETPGAFPLASITTRTAHTGKYSGLAGFWNTFSGEQTGFAGVCQLVTIPASGVLSAYLLQLTNEKNAFQDGQDVFLIDQHGYLVAILAVEANFRETFVQQKFNVGAYAGRKLFIYFGVHGDGGKHQFTHQYVDDVSLTGSGATPKPTATPTANPTATPTSTPTAAPTSTPTAKPTTSPSPVACTGAPKESGPLTDSVGHLASSVAIAFDFPVQHGCNGATRTAALVIDGIIKQSDINLYMKASGVTQTGTFKIVNVDGGGPTVSGEGSLDAETIVGLAPGATVLDYSIPSLTSQNITDAYNKAISDNLADAVNSSFGGCESSDPTGEMATDAIAVQGAAKGITFVGTSGDAGSDECGTGNNPPGVSGTNPPHFLSVGSMDFTQNSTTGVLTGVFDSDHFPNGFQSGGGVSTVFPLPSYQRGIKNVITSGRNQPDLSLPGVDVAVFANGVESGADGTSWSGPEITALVAETAQVNHGTRLGFANPAIYALFTATGYNDFYDITSGTNGAYTDKVGYDQVSGIGAPKGYAFALRL